MCPRWRQSKGLGDIVPNPRAACAPHEDEAPNHQRARRPSPRWSPCAWRAPVGGGTRSGIAVRCAVRRWTCFRRWTVSLLIVAAARIFANRARLAEHHVGVPKDRRQSRGPVGAFVAEDASNVPRLAAATRRAPAASSAAPGVANDVVRIWRERADRDRASQSTVPNAPGRYDVTPIGPQLGPTCLAG